jgi:hypothetical protein
VRANEKHLCLGIFEGSFWVPKLIEDQPRQSLAEDDSFDEKPFEEPYTDSFYDINDRAPEGYEIVSMGANVPTELYEVFNKILELTRNKNFVNIRNLRSTFLRRRSDGSLEYYYYYTPVLTAHPDGFVEINNADYWYTRTTKSRINEFSNSIGYWAIFKKSYYWYFKNLLAPGRPIPYKNKAIITPEGWLALPIRNYANY